MFIRGEKKNAPHPRPETTRGTPRPQRGRGAGGEGATPPSHNPPNNHPAAPSRLRGVAASRDTKQPPTPQSQSTSAPSVVKKTPLTSDPARTNLGLESPIYESSQNHNPHFSWISCLSWIKHNPCVPSVKIRVHPWKKSSHNTKSCVFTNNGVSGICIIFSHRDCVPAFQRRQRTEKSEYRGAE